MHCIDCHTLGDVMGDGQLHGQMEHAVEISCQRLPRHVRPSVSTLQHRARHAARRTCSCDGERVDPHAARSTGREHVVPQVVHVLDPTRPEYDPRGSARDDRARTQASSATPATRAGTSNFLGFHFSRQHQLTQLDLLTGKRTPGRVTTQEKVFSTWKSFYAGLNETRRDRART